MRVRPIRLGVFGSLMVVASVAVPVPAGASCVGPEIGLSATEVVAGDTITVSGSYFFVGCNDTSAPGEESPLPNVPDAGIGIVFEQGGVASTLATVDAGADFNFSTDVLVPLTAVPGDAVISARGANGTPQQSLAIALAGGGSPGRDSDLPRTGGSVAVSLALAACLLFLGLVAGIAARRVPARH
ncbi:MAG: hypothetical protein M5T61_14105 [Acidimicrobiia bacterium]|nr:hypothetical protein [Acidimicrobiia bacterium]